MDTIEVFRGRDGAWRVRVRSVNGRKINVTEPYSKKSNAMRAAKREAKKTAGGKVRVV